jgi:hypothetical protein
MAKKGRQADPERNALDAMVNEKGPASGVALEDVEISENRSFSAG